MKTDTGLEASVRVQRGALTLAVDFAAGPDQVVVVLGPNGAGKTTLLRVLAGLLAVDGGRVVLDGEVLDDPATGSFVPAERRAIGMLFQDYLLFPFLSARDNVAFGLRSQGIRKANARRRAEEWLARVGLADRAGAKPHELSGGQAQRVALARALVSEPRLLLLDEPLAALDAGARAEIRRELRRHLDAARGTRVLVTHDPVDAAVLGHRLVVLEEGRIVQEGSHRDVSAHPRSRYVADLVGVNLYRGQARRGVVRLADGGELRVASSEATGEVFATVHPRAVAIHLAPPEGSPRNRWQGRVTDVDTLGDRVRVRIDGPVSVIAEVTPTAAGELGLGPGREVWAAVKATDVVVYPA